ncbi:hypothetical protein EVAR_32249_1 [Eumeta japonica]|uniref:Uncharacterized protein n=1 Tax=Eumeta variegata TaxID=151549 RepID=A0A4C1WZU6_EUMVA|nr:hypothetical protein EVAR_32249_1 [Eumeta japonica]
MVKPPQHTTLVTTSSFKDTPHILRIKRISIALMLCLHYPLPYPTFKTVNKHQNGYGLAFYGLCAAAVSLLLGCIGVWSGREIDASQAERSGRSCLSIARSALSLAR